MKVLFVCTGNICRSPLAERMLQDSAMGRGMAIDVSSAGTRALNGMPMHPESARILRERDLTPGHFRSRMLTQAIVAESDLILGMSRDHRAFSRQLVPARWKRMFALKEIPAGQSALASLSSSTAKRSLSPTDTDLDIFDPIGQSGAVFDSVAAEIAASIDIVVDWITQQYITGLDDHHSAS